MARGRRRRGGRLGREIARSGLKLGLILLVYWSCRDGGAEAYLAALLDGAFASTLP